MRISVNKNFVIMIILTVFYNIILYTRLLRDLQFPIPYYTIDIVTCIVALFLLIDNILHFKWKKEYIIILLMLLLTGVGLFSNFQNAAMSEAMAVILDIYCCWRFVFLLFFGMRCGEILNNKVELANKALLLSARIATIIYFLLCIGMRLIHHNIIFFDDCIAEVCLLIAILLYNRKKQDIIFILICSVVLCSSGRMVAYAIVLITWILFIFQNLLKIKSKIPTFLVGTFGTLALGFTEFQRYYSVSESVVPERLKILYGGIQLAQEQMPVGTGFGSYCSRAAQFWESKWYSYLHFDAITISCSLDNFWALIIGQFGIIGLIIILFVFISLFLMCYARRNNASFYVLLLLLSYLVIFSFGGNSLFTTSSIVLFVFGFLYSSAESNISSWRKSNESNETH